MPKKKPVPQAKKKRISRLFSFSREVWELWSDMMDQENKKYSAEIEEFFRKQLKLYYGNDKTLPWEK